MNIGIVTTWFERGAALVSRAYMDTLSRQHDVFIYARGGESYAQDDPRWNLPNVTWGKRIDPAYGTDIDWPDFENWIRWRRLDALLFNEQHYWRTILRCAKLDVLIGSYIDYYTAETVPYFDLYDFLLCNTRRHHSVFSSHPQAFYVPWGTDCDVHRPTPRPDDRQGIVFFHSAGMGGVNLRKGTDILVRAFCRVRGPARLIIHSQVGLERYTQISSLIQGNPRIEFVNQTVKAPGLYHLGDVYVYPARLEGIGLTIAEALACGLPVITTDEAPMNEFVAHNSTGVLVPVAELRQREDGYYWPESICSEEALAGAMQRYVDAPALVEEQGQRARTYASEHLDWTKNSRDLPQLMGTLKRSRTSSWALKQRVSRYARWTHVPDHIGQMFLSLANGDSTKARDHFLQGIAIEPWHWRNLGVWSVGGELFLGKRRADALRKLFRAVRGTG